MVGLSTGQRQFSLGPEVAVMAEIETGEGRVRADLNS